MARVCVHTYLHHVVGRLRHAHEARRERLTAHGLLQQRHEVDDEGLEREVLEREVLLPLLLNEPPRARRELPRARRREGSLMHVTLARTGDWRAGRKEGVCAACGARACIRL